jgi:hypothetical protein
MIRVNCINGCCFILRMNIPCLYVPMSRYASVLLPCTCPCQQQKVQSRIRTILLYRERGWKRTHMHLSSLHPWIVSLIIGVLLPYRTSDHLPSHVPAGDNSPHQSSAAIPTSHSTSQTSQLHKPFQSPHITALHLMFSPSFLTQPSSPCAAAARSVQLMITNQYGDSWAVCNRSLTTQVHCSLVYFLMWCTLLEK